MCAPFGLGEPHMVDEHNELAQSPDDRRSMIGLA